MSVAVREDLVERHKPGVVELLPVDIQDRVGELEADPRLLRSLSYRTVYVVKPVGHQPLGLEKVENNLEWYSVGSDEVEYPFQDQEPLRGIRTVEPATSGACKPPTLIL